MTSQEEYWLENDDERKARLRDKLQEVSLGEFTVSQLEKIICLFGIRAHDLDEYDICVLEELVKERGY